MKKKIISLLLAVVMIVGLVPLGAVPVAAAVSEWQTGDGVTGEYGIITYGEVYFAPLNSDTNLQSLLDNLPTEAIKYKNMTLTLKKDWETDSFCVQNLREFHIYLYGHTLKISKDICVDCEEFGSHTFGDTISFPSNTSSVAFTVHRFVNAKDINFVNCRGSIFYLPNDIQAYPKDVYPFWYNFSNITFENCSSKNDGTCVYVNNESDYSAGDIGFESCRFINCNSESNGGAIYIDDVKPNQPVTFNNSYAVNCSAGGDGGFMYINDADANVYGKGNTIITGCTAGDDGGAVYTPKMTLLDGFLFADNRAENRGGAVFNESTWAAQSTISNCRFYRNTCGDDGGAVYVDDSNGTVKNCKFFENDCYGDGYELYSNSGDTLLTDCAFTSNHTAESSVKGVTPGNCTFPAKESYKLSTGDGSQGNPYVISNIDDWDAMYYMVLQHSRSEYSDGRLSEYGADPFKNKYVRLNKNLIVCNTIGKANYDVSIGLSDITYTSKYEFTGTFDGNGHTVTYITCAANSEKAAFGYANGATVRNLTVNGYIKGNWTLGGIFGNAWNCTAENCVNNAEIHGIAPYAGGIVAYSAYTNIINCTNNGKVESLQQQVGGIAGYTEGGSISGCVNNGSVTTGYQKCGGIAGDSANTSIINCTNNGKAESLQDEVGGIAGYAEGGTVNRCTNYGNVVTGNQKAGGIVGQTGGTVSIKNCINHAAVTAPYSYGGGIIGYENGKVTVENCINTGKVNAAVPSKCYPAEGDYVIYSAYDNKYCFDIQGGAEAREENRNLQLWTASNSRAKVFTLKYYERYGAYVIIAKHSGLALTAEPKSDYSAVDWVNVYQATNQVMRYQNWTFEPGTAGGDSYKIRSVDSGFTMNIASGTATDGANIIAYKYAGNDSFKLVAEPNQTLKQVYANGITGRHFGGSTYEQCFYDKDKAIGDRYGIGLSTDAIKGISADNIGGKEYIMPNAVNDVVIGNALGTEGYMPVYFDGNNNLSVAYDIDESSLILGESGKKTAYCATKNEIVFNDRVAVKGNVLLFLRNGSTLTANKGITLESGNSLTVYGSEDAEKAGKIIAYGSGGNATIGGVQGADGTSRDEKSNGSPGTNCGALYLYGGIVTVSNNNGVGFGGGRGGNASYSERLSFADGGRGGNGGMLYLYGGQLKAAGSFCAIGGGEGGLRGIRQYLATGDTYGLDGESGANTVIEGADFYLARTGDSESSVGNPFEVDVDNTEFTSNKYVILYPHTHHTYDCVVYKWSEDNSTCTAALSCGDCPDTMEGHYGEEITVNSSYEHIPGTCTEKGYTVYTAVFESPLETQKKNVTDSATIDHTWIEAETNKAGTSTLKTAANCTNDAVYYKVCTVCDEISTTETWTKSGTKTEHICENTIGYDKSTGIYTVTEQCQNCDYSHAYAFTPYDYLAAEIGAYINTGIKPTNNTRVVMDVYVNGGREYWFGVWDNDYNRSAFAFGNDDTGIYTGYGNEGGTYGQIVPTGYHTIELDKNLVKVDGNLINTHKAAEFQLNNTLYLFAQNRAGNAVTLSGQKTIHCYGCEIYEDGTLVRKFVPCKNENGISGLLDIVNGVFYGNSGSAAMTALNDTVQTVSEQAFTCTENGHLAYYKRGFKYYTNEACTNEITDIENWLSTPVANGGGMLPATGHTWEYLDGEKHKCSVCQAEEAHTDDGHGKCSACEGGLCDHKDIAVIYAWNADYTSCTATKHCNDCDTDILTETATKIELFEDTAPVNCITPGKGHYEATFATLGTAETASEFDTKNGDHHYVDYVCEYCGDELLEDAQKDAIKAIDYTADHSDDEAIKLLAETAEDVINEFRDEYNTVAEVLKIRDLTVSQIEAIKAIIAAAGKSPSKSVKRIVDGAKEDISSAESVEDVISIRDECLADIEKLTGEAHTHTFSEYWSCDSYYHWHDSTCEHSGLTSDFGEHTFGEGIVNGNVTEYTCSECGYKKYVYNPAEDNEGEIIDGTSYTGISLTLGSDISINFYMALTDEARQNGKMTFNIGGRIVTVKGTDAKWNSTEEKYYFSTPLTALEMNETVTATFSYNGVDYVKEYSVMDYIEEIVGHSEKYGDNAVALAKKIANYGYYAQIYLASIHKNVTIVESGADSDKGYDRMMHFSGDFEINVEKAKEALAKYTVQVTGTSDNLNLYGSTVYFDSATALNYYVTVTDGIKPTATAVNTVTGKTKQVEIKLYKNNIYIVSVKDITATELADDIEVKINGGITLTGSVFAYCNSVVNAHSFDGATEKDSFAVNAMASFYEYYEAAYAYSFLTVTFDMNGHGEQVKRIIGLKSGDTVSRPDDPSEDGWLFCGWWTDEYCIESEWDFDTDTVMDEITLYARWKKMSEGAVYLNTGDFTDEISKIEVTAYISFPEDTHTFDMVYLGNGLYSDKSLLNAYSQLFMLEELSYDIVFNDSGIKAIQKDWHPDDKALIITVTGKSDENTFIFE